MVMINPQKKAGEGEWEQSYGFIQVKFLSPGSVLYEISMAGVVPLQMIAIGEMLSAFGKSKILEEAARESIQVPTPIIRGSDALNRG